MTSTTVAVPTPAAATEHVAPTNASPKTSEEEIRENHPLLDGSGVYTIIGDINDIVIKKLGEDKALPKLSAIGSDIMRKCMEVIYAQRKQNCDDATIMQELRYVMFDVVTQLQKSEDFKGIIFRDQSTAIKSLKPRLPAGPKPAAAPRPKTSQKP